MVRVTPRVLAVVLSSLLSTTGAMAQIKFKPQPVGQKANPDTNLSGDGSEFFRALLHVRGIKPVKLENLSGLRNYDDMMIIVIGNPNTPFNRGASTALHAATSAIENGGGVLIASDSALKIDRLLNFSGSAVNCSDQALTLRDQPDCPFAVPVPKRGPGKFDSQEAVRQLFDGDGKEFQSLKRVVAGSPSYISIWPGKNQGFLVPIARFPAKCSTEIEWRDDFSFAVGGEDPAHFHRQSRFLGMASSNIFNNALLYLASAEREEDRTDNLELCFRVIDYLQGQDQHRKRCAFFENGELIEHFDDLARATSRQTMPLPPINLGSQEKQLILKGNNALDELQKNDAPNKLLNSLVPLRSLALIVLWIASISACLFIFRRAIRTRKPADIPPAPTIAGATADPPGVFDRRERELLRRNNIYEPVRDLLRDFFASLGIHGEPGPKPPKVHIHVTKVSKPESLLLAIKDLWRLAYGKAQIVTVSQWRDLEPYFERVKQAHADGKWSFAFEMAH